MKVLYLAMTAILLIGCAQSGYKKFYTPYFDANALADADVELLQKGQEPEVYGTDNFDRDILILRSKKYIPIGYSSFNGGYEDTKNAAAQAKRIGATIVLVSSHYTDTQTSTATLFLPDNKTTYQSGSVYGNTSYNSVYSGYLGSSATTGTYSGTSTTYGSKAVPITSHQRRYDQHAIYLVKSNRKYKFGLNFDDLTPDQRAQYERNTGVLISVVIDDSPAFNANVLVGDVLIEGDGKPVRNVNHAMELMASIPAEQSSCVLKVIRNSKEKEISVNF